MAAYAASTASMPVDPEAPCRASGSSSPAPRLTTPAYAGNSDLEQPWARVKDPVVIPDPADPEVLRAVPTAEFARLVRDHLVPRQPGGVERDRWDGLWAVLRADGALADRTFDVLEEFLDAAEQALASSELDDHQRRRVAKFARFCDDAWQRLRVDDRPLGWAGRAGTGFNPAARRVIEQLVEAIAAHRRVLSAGTPREPDQQLWTTLHRVGLDPDAISRRR